MSTRSYQRWAPEHWDEYTVIDSGDGARLERFGDLILDRPDPALHLAFGAGPHVCPGSFLVRLEAEVAFNALFDRFAALELVSPGPFEALATPMFYGPASLPLRHVGA